MADQQRNPRNSNTTLFKKLTRLFSGPIVNRKRQTYRKLRRSHLNVFGSKFRSATGQDFQKSSYNPFETLQAQRIQNQNRAERYREFDQMEFNPDISCLAGDTEIATLAGFETIKDLADKRAPFEVWAWDEENCKYTVAMGRYAQKTGEKETVIVKLDNGEQFECTADHRIMLKDGSYKQAQNLGSNEALMPFNYKFNKHHGYMEISNPFKPKYKYAHRYIFEDVFEKEIGSNNIHHINHNKRDNRISNLMEMSPKSHMLLHGRHPTTRNKKSNWTKERWKNADKEERNQILSGLRAWQSSEEGKDFMSRHTSHLNRERWKNDPQYAEKMSKIFSNHAKELWQNPAWAEWKKRHHSEIIRRKYANDPDHAEKTKHIGLENGNFYNEVTTEEVLEEGHKYNTLKEFANNFDFKGKEFKKSQYATQFLRRRIVSAGFNGWGDYKKNYEYSNHKVVSVEKTGEVKEVYDLNVPHYHNFALKCGAIVSNSAMDIYADEMTTSNDMNELLDISTSNEEIRVVLRSLYYDILGIEHNLFGWVRTMCKFGDFFLYLDVDKIEGIQSVMGLPAEQIERLEGEDYTNPNYTQYQWNNAGLTFENWQMAHFRILGNDKFAPYGISVLNNSRRVWRQLCVQENMQVTTKNGPKEIKNIEKDDIVYAFNPETKKIEETKVVACKSMGKQDVYDVKTRNKSIKVTYDHGLLVYNNQKNEYGYKAPRDIKTGRYGDRLAVPVVKDGKSSHSVSLSPEDYRVKLVEKNNGIARKNDILGCDTDYSYKNIHAFFNDEKKISYLDFEKVKRNHNLSSLIKEYKLYPKRSKRGANIDKNLEYTVNSEFCRFFGFMLGDGWANDNNKLGFALGEYEDQNKDYKNLLQKFFNGEVYLTEAGNGRGGQVNIHSSEGIRIMKKLGFISGAERKEVPKWIYGMDLECRREFVKGFFDADGSYSDGRVTSINKTLLEGIKKVCGMSGIPAYDIKNDRKEEIREFTNGNTSLCKDSYRMYINMNEDKWFDDYQLQKVKSIELYEENAETYDLQVENDLHNFIVEDIVSHNTLLEDSMMAYRIVRSPERRVFYIDVGNISPNDVEQYMEKIITNMKRHQVIDEDTGRVDLRYNPLCHFPNDFIYLADGSRVTFKELADNWGDYKDDTYAWSLDENHNVVPSKLIWAGETIEKGEAEFVEIELDDGQVIKTTPNHKWLLRDGTEINAEDLKSGDSVMPFYSRYSKNVDNKYAKEDNFYIDIYQPSEKPSKWKTGHKVVAESKHGEYEWPNIIHHKNHIKYDNHPDNLELMSQKEHAKLHRDLIIKYNKSEVGRENSRKNMKKLWEDGKLSPDMYEDMWEDEEIRKKRVDALSLKSDSRLINFVCMALERLSTKAREYEVRNWLNESQDFKDYLQSLNKGFENGFSDKFTKNQFRYHLRKNNFENLRAVKDFYVANLAPWEKIVAFCEKEKPKTRREIIRNFDGISRYDFKRIVKNHNMKLKDFDDQYLNQSNPKVTKPCVICHEEFESYRCDDKKFCSQECYWESLRKPKAKNNNTRAPKNHKVVAVRKYTGEDVAAYGVTVENPTHTVAIGGENAPLLRGKSPKSGVFVKNSVDEDYFIPVRGDSNTRVESLPGGNYVGDIDDVKYLRDKLYAALKIPQSYLSRDEGASEDKTTLAQKDIRFARTITRLQRPVVAELEKIGIIHLLILGYDEEDAINFSLSLNNPSKISEMQELETLRTQLDVASMASEHMSSRQVYKRIFNFSDDEIVRMIREKYFDAKFEGELDQLRAGEEMGGMGGGGLGGELGGEDLEGPEDEFDMDNTMGDEEDLDLGAGEDAGEDDEGLLAAPGKRDLTTTPRSKGKKYKPVKSDKRGMGARKKNMQGAYNQERARNTKRTTLPGFEGLASTTRGIMEKRQEPELIKEIKDIIESDKQEITNAYADLEHKIFDRRETIENIKEEIDNLQKIEEEHMEKLKENKS